MVVARSSGKGGMGSFCLICSLFYKMKILMGMDGGDDCTAVWVYLYHLNWILKNGKFYMYFTTRKKVKPNANVSVSKSGHRLGEDICKPWVAKDQFPIILPVYIHHRETVTCTQGDLFREAHCWALYKQKTGDNLISF